MQTLQIPSTTIHRTFWRHQNQTNASRRSVIMICDDSLVTELWNVLMPAIRKEDIQDLVGEVREMLELRSDPSEAELKRLAQKYGTVIQQVNSILKTCLDLVEKGLKTEAIMRADENNLLELASILDFPEQPVWVDYLQQFSLSAPPVVDQFASRQLNACYAPARRLEPLYRLNRRHALANSPLRVRIGVMRRIYRMEEASAKEVAGRQVELFETERLKRVRKELADALQEKDHRKLHLLCAELSSKDWLQAPDATLVRNAVRALRQEEARRARLRMKELAADLQSMWSAQDVEGGKRVRDEWNACQKQAQLTDSDKLVQETQAGFLWLQAIDDEESRKQRYDLLVVQLCEGLDQRQKKEFLEPLEHALEGFDEGVPDSLRNRLTTRYDELETESRRKNFRRLVVASLSVISIAGLATLILYNRSVSDRIAGHSSALVTFLERGDVEAAETYVKTLQKEQPEMLEVPQIRILITDIKQARVDEDARIVEVQNGLTSVREGLGKAINLADTRSLLELLNTLPSRSAEELQIIKLTTDIEDRQRQIQEQNDKVFGDALNEQVNEFEDYMKSGPMEYDRLRSFRNAFSQLAETADVSPELIAAQAGPKALTLRCETLLSEISEQEKRDQMLQQITSAVGSVPGYRMELDAYAKEFPKDVISVSLENLLRTEADFWPQVEVHNRFVSDHAIDCTTIGPIEARKYRSEAEAFLQTHPQFPRREELTRICDYLQFVSNRLDENGVPIHANIGEQLKKGNLHDLYTVLLRSGLRQYSDLEPELLKDPPRVRIYPLTDSRDILRERAVEPKSFKVEEVDIQIREGKPYWDAPESVLMREIVNDLKTIDERDWEMVMINQLQRVYDETRLDPIFRLFMLRTILESAMTGSPVINKHYSQIQVDLKEALSTDTNPFDPDNVETTRIRRRADELLQPFPNPATVIPEWKANRDSVSKLSLGVPYRWVGWLKRSAAGWICLSDKTLSADMHGQLVIYSKAGTDTPRFCPIGSVSQGKPTVTDASAFLADGHPVYVSEE